MFRANAGGVILMTLVFCLGITRSHAADFEERTSQAYTSDAREVTESFLERVGSAGGESGCGTASLRDGQIIARPGGQDGIIAVPGGLVHHWMGATFMAGVSIEEAVQVSQSVRRLRPLLHVNCGVPTARP